VINDNVRLKDRKLIFLAMNTMGHGAHD